VRRRPWYQLSHKPGAINNRARAKHSSASSSFLKISLNNHCYKKNDFSGIIRQFFRSDDGNSKLCGAPLEIDFQRRTLYGLRLKVSPFLMVGGGPLKSPVGMSQL
jgi:hypothetical protein